MARYIFRGNLCGILCGDCSKSSLLVSESESEWLYYIVDTLRKGQANLLMRSCTEAM